MSAVKRLLDDVRARAPQWQLDAEREQMDAAMLAADENENAPDANAEG